MSKQKRGVHSTWVPWWIGAAKYDERAPLGYQLQLACDTMPSDKRRLQLIRLARWLQARHKRSGGRVWCEDLAAGGLSG